MARSTRHPAWGLAHHSARCDAPVREFNDDYVDRVITNGKMFYIAEVREPHLGNRALLVYRADDGAGVWLRALLPARHAPDVHREPCSIR